MTSSASGKHLLMTADAIGGVWPYASSLAQELARRGWTITLVTFGPAPRQEQFLPLLAYPQIELEITELALEWQDPEGEDRERVLEYLAALEERVRPDVVHINGYREACAPWRAPVVVAAHSCVGSWWRACRGSAPSETGWRIYLADVAAGLAAANRWVAPTEAFRDTIMELYAPKRAGTVIRNGLAPGDRVAGLSRVSKSGLPVLEKNSAKTKESKQAFVERPRNACLEDGKEPFILATGRLWDEAQNVGVLPAIAAQLDWPVRIAGARRREARGPGGEGGVEWLGETTNAKLLGLLRRSGIFVAPAVYEPFGQTVLEAAASGCALVLSDIASFRELWDGAAMFVDPRDGAAMTAALNAVSRDAALRSELQAAAAERAASYTLAAKADAYEQLYNSMLNPPARRTLPLDRDEFRLGAI